MNKELGIMNKVRKGIQKRIRPYSLFLIPNSSSGFTLIETLVAITILIAAVAGPLTIAQKSLASAIYAKDQTVAFYLAEEAIEYIRAIRDENNYAKEYWLEGLESCLTGMCGISTSAARADQVIGCSPSTSDCLLKKSAEGIFGYGSSSDWKATPFTREVSIVEIDPGSEREAVINVTMRWQTGSFAVRSFTIEEHLFNWRK